MKCLFCEKEVSPKRSTKKYCSAKCRVYANRLPDNIARAENIIVNKHGHLRAETVGSPVVVESVPYEFCKHNAVKGFCKKGCK